MSIKNQAAILLALLLTAFNAQASDTILSFSWTYIGGQPEAAIFSINSGVLTQDSIGDGNGYFYYQKSTGVDWTKPFALSVTSRLLADDGSASQGVGAFGFYASTGAKAYAVTFRPGIIQTHNGVISTTVDTGSFHNYLLEINPSLRYRFSVDGSLIYSGKGNESGAARRITFGDGTFDVEARAEITDFRILQSVPEPSTYYLFSSGFLLLWIMRLGKRPSASK